VNVSRVGHRTLLTHSLLVWTVDTEKIVQKHNGDKKLQNCHRDSQQSHSVNSKQKMLQILHPEIFNMFLSPLFFAKMVTAVAKLQKKPIVICFISVNIMCPNNDLTQIKDQLTKMIRRWWSTARDNAGNNACTKAYTTRQVKHVYFLTAASAIYR